MIECVECVGPEVCFHPIPVDGEILCQAKIDIENLRSTQAVTRAYLESDGADIGGRRVGLIGKDVYASAGRLLQLRRPGGTLADQNAGGIIRVAGDERIGVGSPGVTGVPIRNTAD